MASADHVAGAGALSLDLGTKLGHCSDGLVLAVYEDCGEAVVYEPRPPKLPKPLRDLGKDDSDSDVHPWPDHFTEDDIAAELATRQEKNRQRAVSRAVGEVRRYIVVNRLHLMFVLTRLGGHGLHGPEGRSEVMRLVADFVRDLRTELGEDFPYLYSPELHPAGKQDSLEVCPIPDECGCGGHGWHVNFFVGRFLGVEMMKRLWQRVDGGNGYQLKFKDWRKDSRLQSKPFVQVLRAAAAYASKYASKDWSDVVLVDGAHRYEKAQGYQPKRSTWAVADRAEAEAAMASMADSPLSVVWSSVEVEDWDGPICWIYEFIPKRGSP